MRRIGNIAGLLALLYILMFHGLDTRELWSSHEARAAQDAQSLLDSGDWRIPHLFDGRIELQKPPLYYWITASIGWIRGEVDAIAVRLPAVLGSILSGLALWFVLRQSGHPRAGWLAMLVLWTMLHFTWMSRVGRIDMPLTAAVTWTLVSFWQGMSKAGSRRQAWYLLGYFCLLTGIMLKGPIAGVLVATVILPLLIVDKWIPTSAEVQQSHLSWSTFWLSTMWGVPCIICIVMAWAWWMNDLTGGKFIEEFIVKHNLQRGLGGDEQLDGHVHPWWFYLLRFWVDTAPWGLLLPVAGLAWWRKQTMSSLVLLGLIWFFSILTVLSIMQYKRADYLLPAYPGLALCIGLFLDEWWHKLSAQQAIRIKRTAWCGVILLSAGWFSYVQWLLPIWEPQRAMRPFAQIVREYLPAPGQVILFRIDSHQLAWELGKKVERIWEWENLSWWATRPAPIFVVMPEVYARECKQQLKDGELIPLVHNTELSQGKHDIPLILLVNGHGRALARR